MRHRQLGVLDDMIWRITLLSADVSALLNSLSRDSCCATDGMRNARRSG